MYDEENDVELDPDDLPNLSFLKKGRKNEADIENFNKPYNSVAHDPIVIPDRIEGEPDNCYAAYLVYFDLGKRRSIIRTVEITGLPETTIRRWARKWNWKQRIMPEKFYIDDSYKYDDEDELENDSDKSGDLINDAYNSLKFMVGIIKNRLMKDPYEIDELDTDKIIRMSVSLSKMAVVVSNFEKTKTVHSEKDTQREAYDKEYNEIMVSDLKCVRLGQEMLSRVQEVMEQRELAKKKG